MSCLIVTYKNSTLTFLHTITPDKVRTLTLSLSLGCSPGLGLGP